MSSSPDEPEKNSSQVPLHGHDAGEDLGDEQYSEDFLLSENERKINEGRESDITHLRGDHGDGYLEASAEHEQAQRDQREREEEEDEQDTLRRDQLSEEDLEVPEPHDPMDLPPGFGSTNEEDEI